MRIKALPRIHKTMGRKKRAQMSNYGENYQSSQPKCDALYAELKAAYVKFNEIDTPCIVAEARLNSSYSRILEAEICYAYARHNLESAQAKLNVAQAQVNRFKPLATQYDADVIKEKLEKTEKKLKAAKEKFKKATGNKSIKARDRYNAILAKCDDFRNEYETFQTEYDAAETEYDAAKNELDSSETEYDAALGRLQTAIINWEATESKSNIVYYKWNEFKDAFNRCRTAWGNWKSACSQEDARWNEVKTKSCNLPSILSRMDEYGSLMGKYYKYYKSFDEGYRDYDYKCHKYEAAVREYNNSESHLQWVKKEYKTALNNLQTANDKVHNSCLDWENSKKRCYAAWNNWDAAKS